MSLSLDDETFFKDFLKIILKKINAVEFNNHSIQLCVKLYNKVLMSLESFKQTPNLAFSSFYNNRKTIHFPESANDYEKFDLNFFEHESKIFFSSDLLNYSVFRILKVLFSDEIHILEKKFVLKLEEFKPNTPLFDTHLKFNYVIENLYAASLNIVLIKIYDLYNDNFDEFVIEERMFQKLLNEIHEKCKMDNYEFNNANKNKNQLLVLKDKDVFKCKQYKNNLVRIVQKTNILSFENYELFFNILKVHYDNLLFSNNNKKNEKKDEKKIGSKKKYIPKALKMKVWNKHIGIEIGQSKCLCCNLVDISQLNFHCGHVISEKHGGQLNLENLRPICGSCNLSMGVVNMDSFIEQYKFNSENDTDNTNNLHQLHQPQQNDSNPYHAHNITNQQYQPYQLYPPQKLPELHSLQYASNNPNQPFIQVAINLDQQNQLNFQTKGK